MNKKDMAAGYLLASLAIHKIGAVRASSFIYFTPVITTISARLVLHEAITAPKLIGGGLILGGVYLFQRLSYEKEASRPLERELIASAQ